ncbi:MAG: phosphoadenylyl-sulfate reductase [Deltaproteobacteria bacterium]|nr:phosphoadenylyl-sulfate reductase [Deltaproteobacteria bacterium]
MSTKQWSREELQKVNASLEGRSPQEVLKWVADNFDVKEFALASSFAECVLIDMLVKIEPQARVFYIDTGLLFSETLDVVKRVEEKYGIKVERFAPVLTLEQMEVEYGPELWKKEPDRCCLLRKVNVMTEALKGFKLWITGLRREESASRKDAPVVGWDEKFGLIKVNPIAAWSKKEVWDYVHKHDVPYNALLDKGYTSIGCAPCTMPVKPGEDERSGRWAGKGKTECGLHK